MNVVEIDTPRGLARVHVHAAEAPRGALLLGHGAGGGVEARDLVAARDAALAEHVSVALVEQPYRVAGRRSPPPAAHLDDAWVAVVEQLRRGVLAGLSLIVGGRSSGARVACRTAATTGAAGVLCLAFPLRPPGRPNAPSRLEELDAVTVPMLVVQGSRDPYGVPPPASNRRVLVVDADHALRRDLGVLASGVAEWVAEALSPRRSEAAASRARHGGAAPTGRRSSGRTRRG